MIASVLAAIEDESDRDYMLWLYEEFHRLMYAQARRYAPECCEDIVQESMVCLIEHLDTLRGKGRRTLAAYIAVTVRNTALTYRRRQAREALHADTPERAADEPPFAFDPTDTLAREEMARLLYAALDELSDAERLLLEGRYLLDYTDEELAARLQCKPDSIRMKLTRARRAALRVLSQKITREEAFS